MLMRSSCYEADNLHKGNAAISHAVPVQDGLKRGKVSSPFLFIFALECVIMKSRVKKGRI